MHSSFDLPISSILIFATEIGYRGPGFSAILLDALMPRYTHHTLGFANGETGVESGHCGVLCILRLMRPYFDTPASELK